MTRILTITCFYNKKHIMKSLYCTLYKADDVILNVVYVYYNIK